MEKKRKEKRFGEHVHGFEPKSSAFNKVIQIATKIFNTMHLYMTDFKSI